jgi:hypothetical protein
LTPRTGQFPSPRTIYREDTPLSHPRLNAASLLTLRSSRVP